MKLNLNYNDIHYDNNVLISMMSSEYKLDSAG
jgi:hypothetical protein